MSDDENHNLVDEINKEELLAEMQERQRKYICNDALYLNVNDMRRINKYIDTSIFTENCCLWNGYINHKGTKTQYAKFSFKGKKVLLHRIIYHNFKGDISENDEIVFTCKNKGRCCSLNHLQIRTKNSKPNMQNYKNRKLLGSKRLDKETIIEIYKLKDTYKRKEIAEKYNISITTVRNILLGIIHSDITRDVQIDDNCNIVDEHVTICFD